MREQLLDRLAFSCQLQRREVKQTVGELGRFAQSAGVSPRVVDSAMAQGVLRQATRHILLPSGFGHQSFQPVHTFLMNGSIGALQMGGGESERIVLVSWFKLKRARQFLLIQRGVALQ